MEAGELAFASAGGGRYRGMETGRDMGGLERCQKRNALSQLQLEPVFSFSRGFYCFLLWTYPPSSRLQPGRADDLPADPQGGPSSAATARYTVRLVGLARACLMYGQRQESRGIHTSREDIISHLNAPCSWTISPLDDESLLRDERITTSPLGSRHRVTKGSYCT